MNHAIRLATRAKGPVTKSPAAGPCTGSVPATCACLRRGRGCCPGEDPLAIVGRVSRANAGMSCQNSGRGHGCGPEGRECLLRTSHFMSVLGRGRGVAAMHREKAPRTTSSASWSASISIARGPRSQQSAPARRKASRPFYAVMKRANTGHLLTVPSPARAH